MYNYLEGFVIMSQKSCNFALRKSETCPILTYDVHYFFRTKKHSEPKVGGWKESQIRDVPHTDV